jgi:hypothetical protein
MANEAARNEQEEQGEHTAQDGLPLKGVGGAIAGVAGGAAAGLAVGGPPGAVVGAVLGAVAGEGFGYALETVLDNHEATAGILQEEEELRGAR